MPDQEAFAFQAEPEGDQPGQRKGRAAAKGAAKAAKADQAASKTPRRG